MSKENISEELKAQFESSFMLGQFYEECTQSIKTLKVA